MLHDFLGLDLTHKRHDHVEFNVLELVELLKSCCQYLLNENWIQGDPPAHVCQRASNFGDGSRVVQRLGPLQNQVLVRYPKRSVFRNGSPVRTQKVVELADVRQVAPVLRGVARNLPQSLDADHWCDLSVRNFALHSLHKLFGSFL